MSLKRTLLVLATAMLAATAMAEDVHDHAAQGMGGMHEHMNIMEQSMSKMQGMMGCGKT